MVTIKEAYKQIMLDMEVARDNKKMRDEALADLRVRMFFEAAGKKLNSDFESQNRTLKCEATDDQPRV
jgi:hypothetical protein